MVALSLLALSGCGPAPTPAAPEGAAPQKSVGSYEISFRGQGTTLSSAARPLKTQALVGQTLADTPANLTFTHLSSSTFTVTRTKTRYLNVTYRVTNNSASTLNNLTLLPIDTDGPASAGPTIGTTPFKNLTFYNGDDAQARAAEIALGPATRYDRATDDAVTDTTANSFLTGLDGTALQPVMPDGLTLVSVEPRGWRASGNVPAGQSAIFTFSASFPMSSSAQNDPFSFTLMVTAATETIAPVNTVNVIYLVPADKSVHPQYPVALRRSYQHLQRWYADQNGGKTFATGQFLTIQTPHPAAWYASNPISGVSTPYLFYFNALNDAQALAGVTGDPNTWIIYIDADAQCGQVSGAGGGGRSVMSANDLRGLTSFMVEGWFKACAADPDYYFDQPVMRWVGGTGHELGHALGLPHPAGCETGGACNSGTLMWLGYMTYPNTNLQDSDRAILASSPLIGDVTLPVPAHTLKARAYNQDDIGRIYLNGQRMLQVGFNTDSGMVDLSPWLTGTDTLRLTSENTGYGGYAYGFSAVYDGVTRLSVSCGTSGVIGCNGNEARPAGLTYDQTLTLP